MDKIDELIRREVSTYLRRCFSGEFVAVTQVQVAKDFSAAKVWLRSVQNAPDVVKKARELSGEITKHLADSLKLRRVPKLIFYLDRSADHVDRIEELLGEIKKNQNA